MIAKCGSIKTHHWAHESRDDCDPWSENVGPWHRSWQELVEDDFVEVTIGPHRADIVGNSELVVELQHSSIPPDEIKAREQFYGDMVWLFDATQRFPCVPSGDRVFFHLGGTKHVALCGRKVILDCADYIVEVECFTSLFDKFSGYGRLRDQEWFAATFLSDVLKADVVVASGASGRRLRADSWRGKQPWRLTDFPSRWNDPSTGTKREVPAKSVYLPMNYSWRGHAGSVWSDVIALHAEIANGWTDTDLAEMKSLLTGIPMILDGRLRLMPAPAKYMKVDQTVAMVKRMIAKAESHMQAGRIPILKQETLDGLVKAAEHREIERYGRPLRSTPKQEDPQRKLF